MSIAIAKLLREFVYNGVNLADPVTHVVMHTLIVPATPPSVETTAK